MTSPARKIRREAERRAREALAQSGVAVFHGTTASLYDAIRRNGLRAPTGPAVFVTTDRERAAGYAIRAVCLEMVERGVADQPDLAPRALLVTARVEPDRLAPDPACDGDFLLRDGAPNSNITGRLVFDSREWLPDEDGIREYAELTLLARQVEATWGDARIATERPLGTSRP